MLFTPDRFGGGSIPCAPSILFQLLVSTVLLVVVRYLRQLQVEGGLVTGESADYVNYGLMLLYSLSTTTTNTLFQLTIPIFTAIAN